jgi:uncharacterized protein (TIGR02453 family)
MASVAFEGFRPELIEFLSQLGRNNNREWFQAHRQEYERYLVEPARTFVMAMGDCLSQLGSGIHAEPRIRGSIFAINRDVRFSNDKTPYKTYLDLWFWHGDGPSRERPGYFFRLTPETLVLGAGMHAFSDAALERFRQAVLDPLSGSKLKTTAEALQRQGIELGGQTYKRVPAGLPPDHARGQWLRHSGLFAAVEQPVPAQVFSNQLVGLCLEHYQRVAPVQRWLVDLLPE